ncbi:hypothetical protein [Candidatus Amarolinea aalborgensis]|uniref:hypothetical protein n=1 Tax=Candidatus Amarolinea aalborgensis TaxID=2249329 RepID=UPI003BFA24EF
MTEPMQRLLQLNQDERTLLSLLVAAHQMGSRVSRQTAPRYADMDPGVTRRVLDNLVASGILSASQGKSGNSAYTITSTYRDAAIALVTQNPLPLTSETVRSDPTAPRFSSWLSFLRSLQQAPQPWISQPAVSRPGAAVPIQQTWHLMSFWSGLAATEVRRIAPTSRLAPFLAQAPREQIAQLLWVWQQSDPRSVNLLLNLCRQTQPSVWYNLSDIKRLQQFYLKDWSQWNSNDVSLLKNSLAWPLDLGLLLLARTGSGSEVLGLSDTLFDWYQAGAPLQPPLAHQNRSQLFTLMLQRRLNWTDLETRWGLNIPVDRNPGERIAALLQAMCDRELLTSQFLELSFDGRNLLRRILDSRGHTVDEVAAQETESLTKLLVHGLAFAAPDGQGWCIADEMAAHLRAIFDARAASEARALFVEETPWIRHDDLAIHSDLLAYLLTLLPDQDQAARLSGSYLGYQRVVSPWYLVPESGSDANRRPWLQQLATARQLVQDQYPFAGFVRLRPLLAFFQRPWKMRHFDLLQAANASTPYGQMPLTPIVDTLLQRPPATWVRLSWLYQLLFDNQEAFRRQIAGYYWSKASLEEMTQSVNGSLFGSLLWLGLIEVAAQESGPVAVRVTPLGQELLPRLEKKSDPAPGHDVSVRVVRRAPGILSIENHPAVSELIYRAARLGRVVDVGRTWEIELRRQEIERAGANDVTQLQQRLHPHGIALTTIAA